MTQPLTIDETAVMLHEVYQALQKAGFTKKEALAVVIQMMRGH